MSTEASIKTVKSTGTAMTKHMPPPSRFKTCLSEVPVPEQMLEGINVVKANASGKTKAAYLTLSENKFAIYVTTNKFKSGKVGDLAIIRKPFLKKVTSIGSADDEVEHERTIDIGNVARIQRGQNTLRFELARKMINKLGRPKLDPHRCFSIIFGDGRTLDLMVSDKESTTGDTVDALQRLVDTYRQAKLKVGNDVLLLRYIWIDVDKDRNNYVNSTEIAKIFNRINFFMKKADIEEEYHKFGKLIGLDKNGRRRGLSFEQSVTLLHKIKRDSTWQVKPVRQIWFDLFGEYMNNGKLRNRVSAESFLKKFVWSKQGESEVMMEDIQKLFRKLNELELAVVVSKLQLDEENAAKYIDRDKFEAYLVSKENDIFDPDAEKFKPESMNKSLSEYWINSSHNTYLTGDQLLSQSSVEMYMNALYQGCRCLELDCFDGHRDANQLPVPIVYHGGTMTSKILFSDIIDSIQFFLTGNPDCYPLVLSLENHCTLPFQNALAQCLTSTLGENLYIPNEESLHDPLPSPEELKGKVLIKGRRLTDVKADIEDEYDTDSDSEDSEIGEEDVGEGTETKPTSPKAVITKQQSHYEQFSAKLSRITIFHGVRLKDFDESIKKSKDNMLSFDESKARRLCKQFHQRPEWVKYNQTHLTRVYPSGKRTLSSNFSPITAWSTGCQLVALNFQTPDTWRRLNDGRFRENGRCGYVLKPETLLQPARQVQSVSLSLRVLCGTCLPKPKGDKKGEYIDPYVQVTVVDILPSGGKEIRNMFYTHHVHRNGLNPIWLQDHAFRIKVENPDVAILQFTVWDRDVTTTDDFIASSSIPISCIREGYRSVQLYDANNNRNGAFECASLLVDVKIKKKGQEIKMW